MAVERAVISYFGEFWYLNSSCISEIVILLFLSASKDKSTLLQQNAVTNVSLGFQPPPWQRCLFGRAPVWRLPANLQKFGKKLFLVSCIRKIAVTWIVQIVFTYLSSFFSQILDLNLLNDFVLSWSIFRVGQGFWVFGIQGRFKSGIRYIAA